MLIFMLTFVNALPFGFLSVPLIFMSLPSVTDSMLFMVIVGFSLFVSCVTVNVVVVLAWLYLLFPA